MRVTTSCIALAVASALASPAYARSTGVDSDRGSSAELAAYVQCVTYARDRTGIQIYGDAATWWGQAAGRYARGHRPRIGAVMAFAPYRNMQEGHVAVVAQVIDRRTVLLDHANWSPINGQRGQIERRVRAVDVSPRNDWSEVRVWYDPIQALGRTAWPVEGFIYPDKSDRGRDSLGSHTIVADARPAAHQPQPTRGPSREFLTAFASVAPADVRSSNPGAVDRQDAMTRRYERAWAKLGRASGHRVAVDSDPIDAAIARYDN